jgi:transglutaminase-like putative cysteine protease
VILSFPCLAAKVKYPVSGIPDSLKENAKAVIRKNIVEFTLEDFNRSVTKKVVAITILDRNAKEHAAKLFVYDKDREIKAIKATFYDEFGNEKERISKKEFKDVNYDPFGSIYNDTRALYFSGSYKQYPYTIEYEIETIQHNSYIFPHWYPVEDYNQSLESGKLIVVVPKDYKISFQEKNYSNHFQTIPNDKTNSYIWTMIGVKAIDYEPFAPPYYELAPHVIVTPSHFSYDSYSGNFSSWKEFGDFFKALNADRGEISEELKIKLNQMVDGISDPKEKARIIYDYLQDNTRYVSIQVGIGGFQPFPPITVEEFGYGDCKALSYYMLSMLDAVGIKAYYSLVQARKYRYQLDTSFVHDPFNHVILYLPFDSDEIWLECTSQLIPFGFLGKHTDNRYALVIKEGGGVLMKTTSYENGISKQTRKAHVIIRENGTAKANIETSYTGLYYDDILPLLHADYERQQDYLYENHIDIPDFNIQSFSFIDFPGEFPMAKENLELELKNYCTQSGKRIFIRAHLMNRFEGAPRPDDDRKNPFRIMRGYQEFDTIHYHLPENYDIENIPKNAIKETKFGSYRCEYTLEANTLTCIRTFDLHRNEYSKELYNDFVSFCRYVSKADKAKIVLVKSND